MGQWAILAGYLLLPWVALAALRMRRDLRRGAPAVAVALVLSAVVQPVERGDGRAGRGRARLAPRPRAPGRDGGAGRRRRTCPGWCRRCSPTRARTRAPRCSTRSPPGASRPPARSPSLFSLGGTWKTSIVPEERTVRGDRAAELRADGGRAARPGTPAAAPAAAARRDLVRAGGAAGAARRHGRCWRRVGDVVPATALLRDSHRFLAPAVLVLLPGIAGAVDWAARPGAAGTGGDVVGRRTARRRTGAAAAQPGLGIAG